MGAGKAEAQGPSADDIKAAMREAEDEGDAAAAAALEQEAEADLAEFNADPVPAATTEADGDDDDAEPDDGRCRLETFRDLFNNLLRNGSLHKCELCYAPAMEALQRLEFHMESTSGIESFITSHQTRESL